jgi:hypothetical protein
MADKPRVILALTNSIECACVADWLNGDGFDPVRCMNVKVAAGEMQTRRYDLLVADAVAALRDGLVAVSRRRNPMTPVVVIGDQSDAAAADSVGRQAMFLARPLEKSMLACTVSMALMEGRPVRRSERRRVNRFLATVNGMPSHIIDISNEGVRLEIPRDRRWVLPPYFKISVPLIGVNVMVQRMWTRALQPDRGLSATWCGGALTENGSRAERAWQGLVETLPHLVDATAVRSMKIQ